MKSMRDGLIHLNHELVEQCCGFMDIKHGTVKADQKELVVWIGEEEDSQVGALVLTSDPEIMEILKRKYKDGPPVNHHFA